MCVCVCVCVCVRVCVRLGFCDELQLAEMTQDLAHITLGRNMDPFYINIRNPIPQKVNRIPNIDPEEGNTV